jgi:ABC-2 type transport system ATP-binding protein
MPTSPPAVEARGLAYAYGEREALRGLDFQIESGRIFGFLGPNGGGKTTLFRILATLLPPDRGTVRILGSDLRTEAAAVRRKLGVVFQTPSLDLHLTVRENLLYQGWLYGLSGADLRRRLEEGLRRFDLAGREGERASALSGGLRRRLEIAKALLHHPDLLLLDEPSTGLDPGARRDLWQTLEELRSGGVTVLLTTHFMEEGERCDRLALIAAGEIVTEGAPAELERRIGGDVVTLESPDPEELARDVAARFPELGPKVLAGAVRFEHPGAHAFVPRLAEAFPGRIEALRVARPTLEDVFLELTGHSLYEAWGDPTPAEANAGGGA